MTDGINTITHPVHDPVEQDFAKQAARAMTPPPRTLPQRRQDTLERLERDVDAWVATTDGERGTPYLVPLSFLWDGTDLLIATPAASPTGRNLQATGRVRLGLGPTRDLVLIDGRLRAVSATTQISQEAGDAFAAKTGFDPRRQAGYLYFHIAPQRIQAWREANELTGRDLMRGGRWIVDGQAATA
jgi:Pyridoxamine 5'-phosphate oxidase